MKNQASSFFRHAYAVISALLKAKTDAVKSKAGSVRTRLIVFNLLRNKKFLFNNISNKIHALMIGHEKSDKSTTAAGDNHHFIHEIMNKALVVYNPASGDQQGLSINDQGNFDELPQEAREYGCRETLEVDDEEEEEEEYFGDLNCLFDSDSELENPNISVVDIAAMRSANSNNFVLEDEIDQVADLFIKRFHKQMMMQKQDSFKRYQETLNRSA